MPRISAEARDERRRSFIEAGWRCIASKGYRQLTVDDVCAEAGLSKGSFYTYFSEKRDLLLALLEAESALVDEAIGSLAVGPGSTPERLAAVVRALMSVADDPGRAQLRADLWAEVATDEDLRRQIADTLRRRREAIGGWASTAMEAGELDDVPANAFAALLLALADGLQVHSAVDRGGFRWENVQRALGVIFDALSRKAPTRGLP